MKKLFKRILCLLLAIIMLSATWFSSYAPVVYADAVTPDPGTEQGEEGEQTEDEEEYFENDEEEAKMFGSISAMVAYVIRGIAFGIFRIVQSGIQTDNSNKIVTIDDLVFDNYDATSINFYNSNIQSGFTGVLRRNISYWYIRFRNIAIVTYLILLLYIGINILLVVGGRKQEKYKEFLLAWGEGLVLLLFFPYILKFVITLNSALVKMIRQETVSELNVITTQLEGNFDSFKNPKDGEDNEQIGRDMSSNPFTTADGNYMARQANRASENYDSIMDAFIMLIMVFQFILLLIAYYKRLFMIAFLVTIFPITMILYPIDKINDGSAQSFKVWSREVFVNIFTQTFHAIAYVFVMGVTAAGSDSNDWILALVGVTFLFKAEEIIKSILGVGGETTVKSPAETMVKAAAALGVVNKVADGAVGTVKLASEGTKDIYHALRSGWRPAFGLPGKVSDKTRENIHEHFETAARLEPGNYRGPTLDEMGWTPEALLASGTSPGSSDDEARIRDIMTMLGNAENEEVYNVDGTNMSGARMTQEDLLTMLSGASLDYLDDPRFMHELEARGFSGKLTGRESAEKIKKAIETATKKIDDASGDYDKVVQEVGKEFSTTIQAALGGLPIEGTMKYSQGLLKALGANGGMRQRIVDASGNVTYKPSDRLNPEIMTTSMNEKNALVSGSEAVVDFTTMDKRKANGGVLFANISSDKGAPLRGYATKQKRAAMRTFEDNTTVKTAFKGVSQSRKEKIAEDLAVVRTVAALSKLSESEMNKNLADLASVAVGGDEKQLFTAEQYQRAVDNLAKENELLDGAVDVLLKEDSDVSLGASIEEIQAIADETVLVYSDDVEESDTLIDSEGLVADSSIKDKKKEVNKANKSNKSAREIAKRRQEAYDKEELVQAEINTRDASGNVEEDSHEVIDMYKESYRAANVRQIIITRRNMRRDLYAEYSAGNTGYVIDESVFVEQDSQKLTDAKVIRSENMFLDAAKAGEKEIQDLYVQRVNGKTEEEHARAINNQANEGIKKIRKALLTAESVGIAAVTTGPMAIGTNMGLDNPFQEWIVGTGAGAAAINPNKRLDKKKKIRVKDEWGKERTIEIEVNGIDSLSIDGANFMKVTNAVGKEGIGALFDNLTESKAYEINDLRSVVPNDDFINEDVSKLSDLNAKDEIKKQETFEKRRQEIAQQRTARIASRLHGGGRRGGGGTP